MDNDLLVLWRVVTRPTGLMVGHNDYTIMHNNSDTVIGNIVTEELANYIVEKHNKLVELGTDYKFAQ